MKTRVRFAPSPTGFFHVGSARTTLFNYLYAKKTKGKFILRIEDTDQQRSKKEYEEDIFNSLNWLNLNFDEGPGKEGKCGPYRQSERKKIYKKYITKLFEEKKIYPCFCTKQELEKERNAQLARGEAPKYSGKCRNINSDKAKERIAKGEKFIFRLKIEKERNISFEDKIRGQVSFHTSNIGDFPVSKGFDQPFYNTACAIDDHEMKITDIIRGEDHISNTPKQILIQEALKFQTPNYAHLPLILAPDKSKMSKRFGAVTVSEYKKMGFLPEALINFLALLGWSPGDNREFFTLDQLEDEFSVERCKKSGAVFNKDKLEYINSLHIKNTDCEKLTKLCIPYLIANNLITPEYKEKEYPPAMGARTLTTSFKTSDGRSIDFDTIKKIIKELQDRMTILSQITELSTYFFKKINTDLKLLQWKQMEKKEILEVIDKAINILSNINKWEKDIITKKLLEEANQYEKRGKFLWPLRAALTGEKASIGPFEMAWILGQEEAIKRLREAKKSL